MNVCSSFKFRIRFCLQEKLIKDAFPFSFSFLRFYYSKVNSQLSCVLCYNWNSNGIGLLHITVLYRLTVYILLPSFLFVDAPTHDWLRLPTNWNYAHLKSITKLQIQRSNWYNSVHHQSIIFCLSECRVNFCLLFFFNPGDSISISIHRNYWLPFPTILCFVIWSVCILINI